MKFVWLSIVAQSYRAQLGMEARSHGALLATTRYASGSSRTGLHGVELGKYYQVMRVSM